MAPVAAASPALVTRWARREGTATTRAGSAGVSLGWAGPGATPVWSAFGGSHDRDAKVKQFFKFILNLLYFSSLPLPRMRPLRERGPRLRPRHWSLRLPSPHHREEMSDMPGRSMGLPPIHGMQGEEGCYLYGIHHHFHFLCPCSSFVSATLRAPCPGSATPTRASAAACADSRESGAIGARAGTTTSPIAGGATATRGERWRTSAQRKRKGRSSASVAL